VLETRLVVHNCVVGQSDHMGKMVLKGGIVLEDSKVIHEVGTGGQQCHWGK